MKNGILKIGTALALAFAVVIDAEAQEKKMTENSEVNGKTYAIEVYSKSDKTRMDESEKDKTIDKSEKDKYGKPGEMHGSNIMMKDTLVFENNMFESKERSRQGFAKANFTERKDGKTTKVQATTTSPTEGTIEWDIKVTGNRIEGTEIWKKGGMVPMEYSFSGREIESKKKDKEIGAVGNTQK